MALELKNKLCFIDGSLPQPKEDYLKFKQQKKINTLIRSCILNTTEPSLHSLIMKMRVVKIMWDELLQRFRMQNGTHYCELKAAIMSCKHKRMSVATYFAKLKKLWDKIANHETFSMCDCEKTVTELTK